MSCPCDSGQSYPTCCEPLHQGQPAGTAKALMRSRYSAYVHRLVPYLITTVHPTVRDQHDALSIHAWAERANWQSLRIHASYAGQPSHNIGIVDFTAAWTEHSQAFQHRECSLFRSYEGHWFYVDGTGATHVPGRNDVCLCGSGKRFKKCCG